MDIKFILVENRTVEEEALRNTPNEMKTSGEIQLGFLKYGIQ
ncbi:hypothetical protein [Enterococcus saccharolyticus]